MFNQNWFTIQFSEVAQPLGGKTILIKPGEQSNEVQDVELSYVVEKGRKGSSSTYLTGNYTMKLEFGATKDGKIPGEIHLRLLGEPESFVVGSFVAEIE